MAHGTETQSPKCLWPGPQKPFLGGGGFSHKEETDRRMSWDQDVNQTLRPPNPAN